jgi:tetratricopeptide (TPR) repeat protein
VLVGEAFNRLDVPAQRVMQALAAYRYPVSPVAVDYLLQPYVPGVDSAPVLKRLVNMQFARREAGRYYVHQLDRDYALTRIPEANTSEPGALTRIALTRRAADWFKQTRKPREEWKTLDDLAPQLSEYELRISGDQYDEAAAVLLEVDFNYLQLWGHFRLAAELESRLQGNISDPRLDFASALTLGIAYYRMGQYQQAIACEQRALSLAREHGFRSEQAFALGNLALDYAELGFNERSIQHHEEALAIYREVGDRGGEATTLDNLANQYSQSGELAKCVEYRQLALAIDRELADQRGEAHHLTNLAHAFRNLGDFDKALRCLADAHRIACDISYRVIEMGSLSGMADVYFTQGNLVNAADKYKVAIELADASSVIQFQCEARIGLASTLICKGELAAAHQAADVAMGFDFPLSNDEALLTVGTVALLERDCERARDALSKAVRQADELLARNSRKFTSLDCKGLAACGLALCDNVKHVQIASEAFAAARAIVSAPGAVMRVLRIFDALALADTTGLLQPLRPVAAGGTMTASTILQ